MPGSKQHVGLDRRSLIEAYLMGVVRRFDEVPASVWRLSNQRSELWVSTSVTLAVSSMVMSQKSNGLHKKRATTLVKAAAARPPKRPLWWPLMAMIVILLALFQQYLVILPFASWFVYFLFPGDILGLCS